MNSPISNFTPGRLSAELGIPKRTLLSAIKSGSLPAYRINRRLILIRSDEAARWFASTRTSRHK